MGLLDKWNKNKFSIYKSEEKTVLKLIESIGKWLEDLIKITENKTDLHGDHKGTWQGYRPSQVDAAISSILDKHTSQLAETAKKSELNEDTAAILSEIAVERARINSFTTLASGSTTGDAELIDARVGADGVTYANVGEAIRNQFSLIKEDIDEISLASVMIEPFNLLDFTSIENNKNLQSYTGLVIDGDSKVTNFIPLKYNETLAIYDASYNRTTIDSICEYGKNGNYLNGATLLGAIEYTPTSKDCAYIKLQNRYINSSFQVIKGGYIPEQNYPYFTPYYQNVPQNCVIPEQFGAIGNGEFDCAKSLQRCVEYAQNNKKTLLLLPNKTYYISRQVNLTKPVNINGNNATIKCGGPTGLAINDLYRNNSGIIENLVIDLNYKATKGIYVQHSFGKVYKNIVLKHPAQNGWGIYIQRPSDDGYITSCDNIFRSIRGIGSKINVNGFIYCNGSDNNFYDLLYQNMNFGFRNVSVGGTVIDGLRGWVAGQAENEDYAVNYRDSYLLYNSGTAMCSNLFADTICTPLYLLGDHSILINGFEMIFNSNFSKLLEYANGKNYVVYTNNNRTSKIGIIGCLLRNKIGESGYYIDFSNNNIENVIGKIIAY